MNLFQIFVIVAFVTTGALSLFLNSVSTPEVKVVEADREQFLKDLEIVMDKISRTSQENSSPTLL